MEKYEFEFIKELIVKLEKEKTDNDHLFTTLEEERRKHLTYIWKLQYKTLSDKIDSMCKKILSTEYMTEELKELAKEHFIPRKELSPELSAWEKTTQEKQAKGLPPLPDEARL